MKKKNSDRLTAHTLKNIKDFLSQCTHIWEVLDDNGKQITKKCTICGETKVE